MLTAGRLLSNNRQFKKITGSRVALIFGPWSQLYDVIPRLHSLHAHTADLDGLRRSSRYGIGNPFQSFFGGGSLIGGSFVGGSLIGGLGSSSFGGGLGGSSSVIITANTVL